MISPRPLTLLALTAAMFCAAHAEARVTLESICSIYGQKPIRLTGIGLVVGLDGSGDRDGPSLEALSRALDLMGNPVVDSSIREAKNVALVMLEATIPAEGLRIGERIDVHCSSILSAESLRGGRLIPAPLMLGDRRGKSVLATAAGGISIDSDGVKTNGRIPNGAIIEANLFEEEQFLANVFSDNTDPTKGKIFKLVLDPAHASFSTATTVAAAINADFRDIDIYGRAAARAVGPTMVEVTVPPQYSDDPISFVAEVLEVGIDRPHTKARVVINSQSNTVIVTGEAALSPVTISHPGVQVEIGQSFRTLADPQEQDNNTQLRQLVSALGQLQVSTPDVISIVRELHASGKLHAELIER